MDHDTTAATCFCNACNGERAAYLAATLDYAVALEDAIRLAHTLIADRKFDAAHELIACAERHAREHDLVGEMRAAAQAVEMEGAAAARAARRLH